VPELPEVETTVAGIRPWLENKTIRQMTIHQPRLRWAVPADLPERVGGQVITAVRRRGKYIIVNTAAGDMLVHLGMSGSLRIDTHGNGRRKHDHVEWQIGDAVLRFHDPRRFGCVLFAEQAEQHRLIACLGVEPLDEAFHADYLYRRSRGRRQAVKNFIMNARIVVGVGNIYASEALFAAGIWPEAEAGRLSRASYQRLTEAIRQTLSEAIGAGGTTLQDFVNADGQPGYFAQSLKVYGRAGQVCIRCGATIVKRQIGQRSSYFCPRCQQTGRYR